MASGWICPRCDTVLAPTVREHRCDDQAAVRIEIKPFVSFAELLERDPIAMKWPASFGDRVRERFAGRGPRLS